MNADAFRQFFEYHFKENHSLWECFVMQLSQEQFIEDVDYSHGSIRDQIVHLMSVDRTWFTGLRGGEIPEPLNPASFSDREAIRYLWDTIEQEMCEYLGSLCDNMLLEQPLEGEDKELYVWQVLLHVVNHGTDHRAQMLRILNDFGIKTTSQDYIFFVYDNP